jgi:hypothetical protein
MLVSEYSDQRKLMISELYLVDGIKISNLELIVDPNLMQERMLGQYLQAGHLETRLNFSYKIL